MANLVLNAILLMVFVLLVAATTIRYIHQSLIHPLLLTNAILMYYVLAPAGYLLGTEKYLPWINNGPNSLTPALGVLLGMYLVILVTFYVIRSKLKYSFDRRKVEQIVSKPSPKALFMMGLIGFIFGIIAYTYYVFINGGIIRMFTIDARLGFQTVPNTGKFRLLGLAGIMGGFVTTWMGFRPIIENRRMSVNRGVLALLIVINAVTIFIMMSTRSRMLITLPLAFVLVYLITLGQIPSRYVIGSGVVVISAVISFSAIESVLTGSPNTTLVSGLIHTPRLENFIAVVTRVPSKYPFQWGGTFLRLPIGNWSTRGSVLYGNQVEIISRGNQWKNHSSSAMWPGELWLNFGLGGVLVGGIFYGGILAAVDGVREQLFTSTGSATNSVDNVHQGLKRGFYPAVLLSAVLILPTNFSFVVSSIWLRLLVPAILAYFAASLFESRVGYMGANFTDTEN